MDPNYRWPGSFHFVNEVAKERGDESMAPRLGRLVPMTRALDLIGNSLNVPDPAARAQLLEQAYMETADMEAGIDAVKRALAEAAQQGGVVDPTRRGTASEMRAARRPPERFATRPTVGSINTAPIPADDLGVSGSARPPGYQDPAERQQAESFRAAQAESERIAKEGIDEGMSGGPPRPDTSVNQSFNQVDVPTQYEQPPMSAVTFKQTDNPPNTEPNETDDGTGATLLQTGRDKGSGLTLGSSLAEQGRVPEAGDFAEPPAQTLDAAPPRPTVAESSRARQARRGPNS